MLSQLRRQTGSHRGKAQLSLAFNFASRAPSILGMLFFIPLIHRELGEAAYGELMTAMALGGLSSMLFGGGNTLGRRRIGEAVQAGQRQDEANAFLTLARSSMAATVIGVAIGGGYALLEGWSPLFLAIVLLPILNGMTGALDEARAAYHEHYVTAFSQSVLQILAYAIGLTVVAVGRNPLLAALVMVGPGILASLLSGGLLLKERRYVLRGSAPSAWRALAEGLPIGLIDGLVMMAVNLSVVLMQASLPAAGGAWYATEVRLFMILLTPVVLTLVPMTSYLRSIWGERSRARQSRVAAIWTAVSILYGIGGAGALWISNEAYLHRAMGLSAPLPGAQTLAIYAGLGAVVTFKCFSGFGYMILSTRALNCAFGASLLFSLAAGLVGLIAHGPISAVLCCAISFAACVPLAAIALHFAASRSDRPRG